MIQAARQAAAQPQAPDYADRVQRLHDQLQDAVQRKDLAGVRSALASVHGVLDEMHTRQPRVAGAHSATLLAKAQRQDGALMAKLGQAAGGEHARALPPVPAGGLLATVGDLLKALLASLQALVGSLLGGGLPTPPLPPVPPVPGA